MNSPNPYTTHHLYCRYLSQKGKGGSRSSDKSSSSSSSSSVDGGDAASSAAAPTPEPTYWSQKAAGANDNGKKHTQPTQDQPSQRAA